jgi:PAS domain S-box-containing protein
MSKKQEKEIAEEDESQQAQQRFVALSEATSDICWLTSVTGEIKTVSRSWEKFTGQRFARYGDFGWLQALYPDDRERFLSVLKQSVETGQVLKSSCRIQHIDGKYRTVHISSIPVLDEHGKVYEWLGTGQDMIAQRHDMQLSKLLPDGCGESHEELASAEKQRDSFINIVSHELRTPLAAIKGNLQLAQRRLKRLTAVHDMPTETGNAIDSALMLLARALNQVGTQNIMIGAMLDVSRILANKLELLPESIDILPLVHKTVEQMRASVPERTIECDFPANTTVIMVAVDVDRFTQVLTQYIMNALKYAPAEYPVQIKLMVDEQEFRFCVRDRGPGLSIEEQSQVWERFYQVKDIPAQKGFSPGLGLGLYISQALIHALHGEYGVESRKGEGSMFWFTLPLVV